MNIGNDRTVVPPFCHDVLRLFRERVGGGSGSVLGVSRRASAHFFGLLAAHAKLEQYGKLRGSV